MDGCFFFVAKKRRVQPLSVGFEIEETTVAEAVAEDTKGMVAVWEGAGPWA